MTEPEITYSIVANVVIDGDRGKFEQTMPRELLDDPVALKIVMQRFDAELIKRINQHLDTTHGEAVETEHEYQALHRMRLEG